MPASLYTHVVRYCEACTPRCRGHREPRRPVVDYTPGLPVAQRRSVIKPLDTIERVTNYVFQLRLLGRGALLTPRQRRRANHKFNALRGRAAA